MNDAQIIASWKDNGAAWTNAVREGRIQSRIEITNAAIIDAILARDPKTVFDIGCGEGWLARELAARDIAVFGVDIVPEMVDSARRAGGGRFAVMAYAEVAEGAITERFDLCVCNFSLLGERVSAELVAAVPALLNEGGALIVQTLHPRTACGDAPYCDGWRPGSWRGIEGSFGEPAPWYFRTVQGWMQLFADAGLGNVSICEPTLPGSDRPASLILIGEPDLA